MLDLLEKPGAKRFVVIAGDVVVAPIAVHNARAGIVEGVPAWHGNRPGKDVSIAAQAQVHLQTGILRLLQTSFQVSRPAMRLLLVDGIHNAAGADGTYLVKIALHTFRVMQWVEIGNDNIHSILLF